MLGWAKSGLREGEVRRGDGDVAIALIRPPRRLVEVVGARSIGSVVKEASIRISQPSRPSLTPTKQQLLEQILDTVVHELFAPREEGFAFLECAGYLALFPYLDYLIYSGLANRLSISLSQGGKSRNTLKGEKPQEQDLCAL